MRPTFQEMNLCTGRKKRLHQLMYEHGPTNGTIQILPIDQGLEHGPIDFLDCPDAAHPRFQFELAKQANFSAIAVHIGLADKYAHEFPEVPLILKLNGKTNVPSGDHPVSTQTGTVNDALRLGAIAVGYTLYVGSSRQDQDIAQLQKIRAEAHYYGLPLIIWAYPRGEAIEAKGGKNSVYAIAYAARVAQEVGADVIKVNFPRGSPQHTPQKYKDRNFSFAEQIKHIVSAAGSSLLIMSGGSKIGEQELLDEVEVAMQQGAAGVIFGRNMWQRPFDEGVQLAQKIQGILKKY